MSEERYFGKDNFTGNRLHKAYKSVGKGDDTIVETFNDKPLLKEKFLKLWTNLANIDRYFSISNITLQENNSMATECELFLNIFPVEFPKENLTRKMLEMSLVLPNLICDEPGTLHKMLALEQGRESLHQIMNCLERKYAKVAK